MMFNDRLIYCIKNIFYLISDDVVVQTPPPSTGKAPSPSGGNAPSPSTSKAPVKETSEGEQGKHLFNIMTTFLCKLVSVKSFKITFNTILVCE